jgi:3-polyprenyl-4-hydroxybenzoate decarboxylase
VPFQDFREFLDALRKHGELFDVDRPVALELEVAKALRKSASVAGPAFVFKNNGTRFPLVAGVDNTRAKALIALEATEETVVERILAGLSKRIPPVVVKDAPVHEIDVHSSDQVEWATAFRTRPARDVIVVDGLPGGPLDPSADSSLPPARQTGSAIGIDATYPFGVEIRTATDSAKACGPALSEHGREYIEVADVPGWQDYDFPELRKRG